MTQSRIQEALVAWLAEAVFRFSVAVHVEKLTPESIEMSFEGVSTAVGAIIKYEEIEPFVELGHGPPPACRFHRVIEFLLSK